MKVKDLKKIINEFPDENAEVCFIGFNGKEKLKYLDQKKFNELRFESGNILLGDHYEGEAI